MDQVREEFELLEGPLFFDKDNQISTISDGVLTQIDFHTAIKKTLDCGMKRYVLLRSGKVWEISFPVKESSRTSVRVMDLNFFVDDFCVSEYYLYFLSDSGVLYSYRNSFMILLRDNIPGGSMKVVGEEVRSIIISSCHIFVNLEGKVSFSPLSWKPVKWIDIPDMQPVKSASSFNFGSDSCLVLITEDDHSYLLTRNYFPGEFWYTAEEIKAFPNRVIGDITMYDITNNRPLKNIAQGGLPKAGEDCPVVRAFLYLFSDGGLAYSYGVRDQVGVKVVRKTIPVDTNFLDITSFHNSLYSSSLYALDERGELYLFRGDSLEYVPSSGNVSFTPKRTPSKSARSRK